MSPIPQPIPGPFPDPVASPSPQPTGDHYDAGAPLDGGSDPSSKLGSSQEHAYSPTGLEIGVITGIVFLVIITVVGIFVWRSRRNRNAKNTEAAASADDPARPDDVSAQDTKTSSAHEPVPAPKDDRCSIEQHSPSTPAGPILGWSHWAGMRHDNSAGKGRL